VRDGVETAMLYAEEALHEIASALNAGDSERARLVVDMFAWLFSTGGVARREDGRIDDNTLIVTEPRISTILGQRASGPYPQLLDALTLAAEEALGAAGAMIAPSKTTYVRAHRENVAVFNANVCIEPGWKVWYGDLDLTLDESKLLGLAARLGQKVYVLFERDGRFGGRDERPFIDLAVYTAIPDGTAELGREIERGNNGRLRWRRRSRTPSDQASA
jgi:hypothetical protein